MKTNMTKDALEAKSTADLEAISKRPHNLNAATVDRILWILEFRKLVQARVHELDVEARYAARKADEVPTAGYPHVLVQREGKTQVSFFCPACKKKHYHGDGGGLLGHRAAHCFVSWSPYTASGYVLVEAA